MPRTSKQPDGHPSAQDTLAASSGVEVLIEETPLGLSAEQMAKSNPQAVEEIRQAAAAQAVEADRKRRAELDAAFADDLSYAAQCYASNKDVITAKADRHDALVAENKALKAEVADLKARVESGKPGFVPSDDEGNVSAAGGENPLAQFEAAYAADPELQRAMSKKTFLALAKNEPQRALALIK